MEYKIINVKVPAGVWKDFSLLALIEDKQKKDMLLEAMKDYLEKNKNKLPGR